MRKCSKKYMGTTETSRSTFACEGVKLVSAPMNLSICSSVTPPCKTKHCQSGLIDFHFTVNEVTKLESVPWVASIQHHEASKIQHNRT